MSEPLRELAGRVRVMGNHREGAALNRVADALGEAERLAAQARASIAHVVLAARRRRDWLSRNRTARRELLPAGADALDDCEWLTGHARARRIAATAQLDLAAEALGKSESLAAQARACRVAAGAQLDLRLAHIRDLEGRASHLLDGGT
jgi:hypothetical protein